MDTPSPNSGAALRQELSSDAHTVADTAKQRIHSEVDARKGTAATQAKSLSSALESAAGQLDDSPDWLRSAFQQGAQKLQRFADQLEHKDSRQLSREVQQLARQNPGTFLAACAAAGFAAARVIKAGAEGPSDAPPGGYPAGGQGASAYDPYATQNAGGATPLFGGNQSGYSTSGPIA